MMVMTAKVNKKKIIAAVAGIAAIAAALFLLLGRKEDARSTAAPSGNDARVHFLEAFGWEVTAAPTESSQVRIPRDPTEVYQRYNALQKTQGYDLSQYAGKTVMRYVYEVRNYPGSAAPVYATLLVYKDKIIGGDITDTAAKGKIQGFARNDSAPESSGEAPTVPQASDA